MRLLTSNFIVEGELDEHLKKIEEGMGATVLSFYGPILYGVDAQIRDAVEKSVSKNKKGKVSCYS